MVRAKISISCLAMGLLSLSPAVRAAVSDDNFLVKTTGDLVALCSADPADKMMTAATNFCHGFVVGTYRVLSEQQSASRNKLFCPPATLPSRNEAIARFVTWAKANSAAATLSPTDGMLKYLMERFPCPAKQASH
jgi:hypothetical protein